MPPTGVLAVTVMITAASCCLDSTLKRNISSINISSTELKLKCHSKVERHFSPKKMLLNCFFFNYINKVQRFVQFWGIESRLLGMLDFPLFYNKVIKWGKNGLKAALIPT